MNSMDPSHLINTPSSALNLETHKFHRSSKHSPKPYQQLINQIFTTILNNPNPQAKPPNHEQSLPMNPIQTTHLTHLKNQILNPKSPNQHPYKVTTTTKPIHQSKNNPVAKTNPIVDPSDFLTLTRNPLMIEKSY